MWSDGLPEWFAANGRHQLPWRQTTDPWAVLVSEVMLQQTQVGRVMPRWRAFLERWPSPAACASATLGEVLAEWQGLGYPRRARALWLVAGQVAAGGWPADERGLRELPGVGTYTARALLAFSDIGAPPAAPPRDVNVARVARRAALGVAAGGAAAAALDAALTLGMPAGMAVREYTYALFDVGTAHCRATPRCQECPLQAGCARFATAAGLSPERHTTARRQPAYVGSFRQLRGAVLAAYLRLHDDHPERIAAAVATVPGATPERVTEALASLVADGLVPGHADVAVTVLPTNRG